jgi:dipeptidyl aminopeptidase/acylaminoacyl peptidase
MKKTGLLVNIITMAILFASCSVISKQPTSIYELPTVTTTLVPSHSDTSTAADTALTPVSTPSVATNPSLIMECLDVSQNLQSGSTVRGTIIYRENGDPGSVYLWNMETGDKELISTKGGEILGDFIVSPDGHWLAYTRSIIDGIVTIGKTLEIISSSRQAHEKIDLDVNTAGLSRWLNNEQLIIMKGLEPTAAQVVINPFTKQQQELLLDLQDIYNNNPSLTWRQQGIIILDPTLTMVVYAGMPADVVLMDTTNNQVITRISPVPIADSIPVWSPNGSQFVITNADISDPQNLHYELFSISRFGLVSQLTNLAAYYQTTFILSYTWSPDGRYIAFWFENNTMPTDTVDLAVLDTSTLELKNYCLNSTYQGYNVPPSLFWSPDSRQMVVELSDQNGQATSRMILIDILENWATQIAENLTPIGWMISP